MSKNERPFNHYGKGFNYLESSKPEIPQLLQGIGIVYAATHNQNKLLAVKNWIDSFKIIRGEEGLRTIGRVTEGEEVDWTDSLRVCLDKNKSLVDSIRREPGPKALVVGSDVVVWINGEPKHNLSRKDDLTGKDLDREIRSLQKVFSKPSIIMWDVAIGISRKGIRAATGDRITVAYKSISPELIKEIFSEDIKGALGRNTRLPLIDDKRLTKNIIGANIIPLGELVDRMGTLEEWHTVPTMNDPMNFQKFPITNHQLDQFRKEIIGGLPAKDRLKELEKVGNKSYKELIIV